MASVDSAKPLLRGGLWSGAGSNRRPHDFQLTTSQRCADQGKRRSRTSETARVMRCIQQCNDTPWPPASRSCLRRSQCQPTHSVAADTMTERPRTYHDTRCGTVTHRLDGPPTAHHVSASASASPPPSTPWPRPCRQSTSVERCLACWPTIVVSSRCSVWIAGRSSARRQKLVRSSGPADAACSTCN
jgi:hypothetical protein